MSKALRAMLLAGVASKSVIWLIFCIVSAVFARLGAECGLLGSSTSEENNKGWERVIESSIHEMRPDCTLRPFLAVLQDCLWET